MLMWLVGGLLVLFGHVQARRSSSAWVEKRGRGGHGTGEMNREKGARCAWARLMGKR